MLTTVLRRFSLFSCFPGVDVILDVMGASYLPQNLKALRSDGRLFVLGMQGGRVGELDLGRMLVKRLSVACKCS